MKRLGKKVEREKSELSTHVPDRKFPGNLCCNHRVKQKKHKTIKFTSSVVITCSGIQKVDGNPRSDSQEVECSAHRILHKNQVCTDIHSDALKKNEFLWKIDGIFIKKMYSNLAISLLWIASPLAQWHITQIALPTFEAFFHYIKHTSIKKFHFYLASI